MPEITMCANEECPMRKDCYRHEESGTEPHVYWQSWAEYQPKSDNECEHFMEKLK